MLTMEQIRDYPIAHTAFGGCRAEDVDNFRDEVLETCQRLFRDNQELIQKLQVLAAKVEQQQAEAEEIRLIMVRAQHDADSIRAEANQEAQDICEKAQAQANEMLEQAAGQADAIIRETDEKIASEQEQLARLQAEVGGFKSRLISIYREHIDLISALPDYDAPEEEIPEASEELPEPEEAPEEIPDETEPEETPEEVPAEPEEIPDEAAPEAEPEPEPEPEKADAEEAPAEQEPEDAPAQEEPEKPESGEGKRSRPRRKKKKEKQ